MKLTPKMKQFLQENCNVTSDASDEAYKTAAGAALASGVLTAEKLVELSTTEEAKASADLAKKLDSFLEVAAAQATASQKAETQTQEKAADETPSHVKSNDGSWYEKVVSAIGTDGGSSVRVKGAHEQYATTKSVAMFPETNPETGRKHALAGQPMRDFAKNGRIIDNPSDLDRAVAGAWCQYEISKARMNGSRSAAFKSLTDHSRELLCYGMSEMKWAGATDGGDYADINNRKLSLHEQKALIDDATSGGLEAAPIVFDDMVIQAPLLTNELFPLVNTIPLERGRRVEGVSISTVTSSWGGVDDTAITLFNTASYVSAFDTTIYRWQGAIKIGLDFLSDTPIDFGTIIAAQYGERLAEDLDDVIAAGNGTTQPEGVINKSGTTSVAWGGTTSLSNYESLRFGVSKAEHTPAVRSTAVFCGTETSYQRARALPVGASDARRLFGMDYDSYSIMGRPYKINESLSNSQIFYALLGRYRMYRRRGLTMRTSTEGDTLIRDNEMLIAVTARFGGQLERGACAAVTTTAPS